MVLWGWENMKRICFFSGDITRSGGTERVSTMIANALAEQGKYQILFLSLMEGEKKPFFELHESIQRYVLGEKWINPGPGYLKVILRLRRFLKQYNIHIIIDIDIVLDILSIPASRGLDVKVVSWEHSNYNREMESLYRRYILKYSVKHSDYIVTLTEKDKKTYIEKTGRKENISAIYNPIQKPEGPDISQKEQWLLTVGHLTRMKGTDYLAGIAKDVLKRFPDWKWMVVGDGEEQVLLQEFVEKNHLTEQMILTGKTDDVDYYLKKAQIFVMTSRTEGLPMCLLEAKAFSIPSVSFDIQTGPNEIIKDGVNGYLIRPFDCQDMTEKLMRLMGDETLRAKFSDHVHDDIEKFQMETILSDWNQVLEQVM